MIERLEDEGLSEAPPGAEMDSRVERARRLFTSLSRLTPLVSQEAARRIESSLALRESPEWQKHSPQPGETLIVPLDVFMGFGVIFDLIIAEGHAPALLGEPDSGISAPDEVQLARLVEIHTRAESNEILLEIAGLPEDLPGIIATLFPNGLPERARQIEFQREGTKWVGSLAGAQAGTHACYLLPAQGEEVNDPA